MFNEELHIRITERHGAMLVSMMMDILSDPILGLTQEQLRSATGIIRQHIDKALND